MRKNLLGHKGFTLIEVIVVIAILGILVSIGILYIKGWSDKSMESQCLANRTVAEKAYQVYLASGGGAVGSGTSGNNFLVNAGFITAEPICKAGGTYSWIANSSGTMYISCSVHGSSMGALFSSTFSNNNGIIVLRGSWNVSDGNLSPGAAGENRAVLSGSSGTDYLITANITYSSSSGNNGYGIYYHATDSTDITGYVFQFDPGLGNKFVVRKVENGSENSPFQIASMPAGFDVTAFHEIMISVVNNTHVISVDGVQVLNFTDSTYTSGYVGTRTWNYSTSQFHDITVVGL